MSDVNELSTGLQGLSTSNQDCKIRPGVAYSYDWNEARLPKKDARNVLITSALPYVNNVPHLGNIIGAVLSADVFARYCRAKGYQTLYICGTDEYGTATETKALEEGTSCKAVCDKYFAVHHAVYSWFECAFDEFGRSSTPVQTEITHDIFRDLFNRGFFYEDTVDQLHCCGCDRFLADRYVEGVCPHCAAKDARGDQCDACGKLIASAADLKDPKCKMCKATPQVRTSHHLFLDLTKLQEKCGAFVEEAAERGTWSSNAVAIARAWISEGLKGRCMTRDLKWGTPVPAFPGVPEACVRDKVFYVWFDAPIAYLSITAGYTNRTSPSVPDAWKLWWRNPQDVQLYQFMGKDNVPFHTVIFPSTLIGTGQPYTLLHTLSTTEYLTYEGGKFSKSRGTGVFGTDARDSGIDATAWRYYLLATRPESSDADFSWSDFQAKTNSELMSNLGNLVNRTLKFINARCDGVVAEPLVTTETHLTGLEYALRETINAELQNYSQAMEKVQLRSGLKAAMAISSLGNLYLADSRLDGRLASEEPVRCAQVLLYATNIIYALVGLIAPFMPSLAERIAGQLNVPKERRIPESFSIDLLPGHRISPNIVPLVTRIETATIDKMKSKYGAALAAQTAAAKKEKKAERKVKQPAAASDAAPAPSASETDAVTA